jgi:hypothetical protein
VITTPDLINLLAAEAAPVRRLRSPLLRALGWMAIAALVLAAVGIVRGVRPDFPEKVGDSFFLVGIAAALLTGILAAVAAFLVSLPGRSRLWLLLPAPALAVWIATIGYGCVTAWVEIGPGGISLGETAECFATLALISVPSAAAMLWMLRHAAALRPVAATLLASLAVAAVTASGLLVIHPLDATIMILAWNFGLAALFVGLAGLFRRRMFSWVAPRAPARA